MNEHFPSVSLPIGARTRARAPAHIITSDTEALDVAARLAERFAVEAADRDRDRRLPYEEVDAFSQSGLWAITVPKSHGGAEVSYGTLAKVVETISAADGSLGQIPQNHYFLLEVLRWGGSAAQKRFLYSRVLGGDRFGNAIAELGTPTASAIRSTLVPDGESYRLSGRKYYCSGVLFADWVVPLVVDENDKRAFVFLASDTPGLSLVDDWSGFGQRTTASGTAILEEVTVRADAVVPTHGADGFSLSNPVAHIMHAAIDAGTARGAIDTAIRFIREKARPWADSGITSAAEDPHTILQIGELTMRLHAAEALIERSGFILDRVSASPDSDGWAEAAVAVAEAKMASADVALQASSKLIELGGASATRGELNYDRFWRNVRTHSVHDPIRWRAHEVGNYWLNGIPPKQHGDRSRGVETKVLQKETGE